MAETAKAFGDFCEGAAAGFSPAATALIEGCGFKILILEAGGCHIRPNGNIRPNRLCTGYIHPIIVRQLEPETYPVLSVWCFMMYGREVAHREDVHTQ